MKKQYVPKTLTEFLSESKSIPLKRKYGERPTIFAGTNAPLRNQVLSFVAESGSVSKIELKKFILGLKEGGSTPAAANMFLKRNARYFVAESRNGITRFKLSNLGQRLVNRFAPGVNTSLSESDENQKRKLSEVFVEDEQIDGSYENKDTSDFEVPDEEIEADTVDGTGPAAEVDFEDDRFDEPEGEEKEDEGENFEYEEDDEKIVLTYYKNKPEAEEDEVPKPEETEVIEPEGEEVEEPEIEDEDEDEDYADEEIEEGSGRPREESRKFDFKDRGRPGINDVDESAKVTRAQFVSHNLTGKKSPNLGGKLDPKLHNLLTDKQDKDESELDNIENELTESVKDKMKRIIENLKDRSELKESKLNEAYDKFDVAQTLTTMLEGDDVEFEPLDSDDSVWQQIGLPNFPEHAPDDIEGFLEKMPDSKFRFIARKLTELGFLNESLKESKLNEAEPSEADELKDTDLDSINLEDNPEEKPEGDETATNLDGEVEKVEITEFILTVDDVDAAISDLEELGVTAERVPIEPKEQEVPPAVEEPESTEEPAKGEEDLDLDAEEKPELSDEEKQVKTAKESLEAFVKANYLNEGDEDQKPEDLGTSDELGLGDQGAEATELEDKPEELTEPTTEFEENKIKVKAEDWDILKGYLEGKGVDVKEMFGGDIETEEVEENPEGEEAETTSEEVPDEEIDFSGISDEDETKIEEK